MRTKISQSNPQAEQQPTATAVIGAPAAGKSYSVEQVVPKQMIDPSKSVETTIDKVRGYIQSLSPDQQLELFFNSYFQAFPPQDEMAKANALAENEKVQFFI